MKGIQEDYLHLLRWIRAQGLVAHVPAVQLSIRMLIPPDSALLETNRGEQWLRALDAANFGYGWVHPDARMDALQQQVAALAEAADDDNPYTAFAQVEAASYALAGVAPPPPLYAPAGAVAPPRLSEHWFC